MSAESSSAVSMTAGHHAERQRTEHRHQHAEQATTSTSFQSEVSIAQAYPSGRVQTFVGETALATSYPSGAISSSSTSTTLLAESELAFAKSYPTGTITHGGLVSELSFAQSYPTGAISHSTSSSSTHHHHTSQTHTEIDFVDSYPTGRMSNTMDAAGTISKDVQLSSLVTGAPLPTLPSASSIGGTTEVHVAATYPSGKVAFSGAAEQALAEQYPSGVVLPSRILTVGGMGNTLNDVAEEYKVPAVVTSYPTGTSDNGCGIKRSDTGVDISMSAPALFAIQRPDGTIEEFEEGFMPLPSLPALSGAAAASTELHDGSRDTLFSTTQETMHGVFQVKLPDGRTQEIVYPLPADWPVNALDAVRVEYKGHQSTSAMASRCSSMQTATGQDYYSFYQQQQQQQQQQQSVVSTAVLEQQQQQASTAMYIGRMAFMVQTTVLGALAVLSSSATGASCDNHSYPVLWALVTGNGAVWALLTYLSSAVTATVVAATATISTPTMPAMPVVPEVVRDQVPWYKAYVHVLLRVFKTVWSPRTARHVLYFAVGLQVFSMLLHMITGFA
ncbi:hypothetical protein BC828DRAFT_31519, partial [Blastocladiella britannica]